MRLLVVLLLLATALAGCSDDAPEADHAGHGVPPSLTQEGYDPSAAPVEAPLWSLGQYWSFRDNLNNTYSLVVAEDAGGDWVVLTNDKTIARFDALFDISFVGNVRKADLAGQQGSERIQFFDFPLHHGKDWTTTWDGLSRHVVAHGLGEGRFHIIAHVAGNEVGDAHANYVYDSNVGHFESITFFDANGTATYVAQRTDAGTDFAGTLYRFGARDTVLAVNVTPPGVQSYNFEVPAAPGELTLTAVIDCADGQGVPLYAVQQPQEDGSAAPAPPTPFVETGDPVMGNDQPCPEAEGTTTILLEDPPAGFWRFDGTVPGSVEGAIAFTATWQPRDDIPL